MLLRTLITGILIATLTTGAFAQVNTFPKPSYFRETFAKSKTTVDIKDPVRLKDFVLDGKLELTLKNYLDLVMTNNTNIQIQTLSIETPKNAIQRAMGVWDPTATASFNSNRSTSLTTNVLEGGQTVSTLTQPFSSRFNQPLDMGGTYFVQYNANKSSTSNTNSTFYPSITSNLQAGFTQNLLRNRGRYVNRINLMVARSNLRVSDYTLRNTLLQSLSNAEQAYWNAILARENIKVAEGAKEVAKVQADYVQRQLDLGALSPLDIFQTKQLVAQADLTLAQAQFSLRVAEDALRLQIAADLDPEIRKLPVVLTEPVEVANWDAINFDPEQSVQQAYANRQDLKAATQRLDVDDLQIQGARNNLLPQFTLTGNYQSQGLGGNLFRRPPTIPGAPTPAAVLVAPGGFGDALSQMFGFGYPIYSFGVSLNLPIRNRAAAMDLADALVRKKSDTLTLRQNQEQIRLSVLNGVTNLNGAREQLKLAKILREISQSNYDAMKQKYELGVEQLPNVVRAAQDLTSADFTVAQRQIDLRRNLLTLYTQTGELLDQRGIVIQ